MVNHLLIGFLLTLLSAFPALAQDFSGREQLRAHSNEFRKEVIRITDGVYVAVGYSASNVVLIQGSGGSIIVDTATDPNDARAIRAAFGNLLTSACSRHHLHALTPRSHRRRAGVCR